MRHSHPRPERRAATAASARPARVARGRPWHDQTRSAPGAAAPETAAPTGQREQRSETERASNLIATVALGLARVNDVQHGGHHVLARKQVQRDGEPRVRVVAQREQQAQQETRAALAQRRRARRADCPALEACRPRMGSCKSNQMQVTSTDDSPRVPAEDEAARQTKYGRKRSSNRSSGTQRHGRSAVMALLWSCGDGR